MLCTVNLGFDGYRGDSRRRARRKSTRPSCASRVSLILLDIHLGADNGLDIARRPAGDHPELSIAFFTGSARVVGEDKSLADGVLSKPFTLEEPGGDRTAAGSRRPLPPP